MSNNSSRSLNQQIISTLDHCLLRMSETLEKQFDPQQKESLTMFKQFCSALNARRQFVKSLLIGDDTIVDKRERIQDMLTKKPYKDYSQNLTQDGSSPIASPSIAKTHNNDSAFLIPNRR